MAQTIPSEPFGRGLTVSVIVAQWHGAVTGRLLDGALHALEELGVRENDILVVEVPGAYELPQAAQWTARAQMADAIVVLGCVIRGETPHFDHIARSATDGCLRAAQDSGIPVGLGVITAETLAQAEARSATLEGGISKKGGNKGIEAADAAVRMANTYRKLEAKLRG